MKFKNFLTYDIIVILKLTGHVFKPESYLFLNSKFQNEVLLDSQIVDFVDFETYIDVF